MVALKIKLRRGANYEKRKLGSGTQLGDETNSVGVVKKHEDFLTTPWGNVKYDERTKDMPSLTPKIAFKLKIMTEA